MPFVSMIMVRSMSQTTERFYLCSANDFVRARRGFVRFYCPQMYVSLMFVSTSKKVPPPKIPIRQPVNYLRGRFSMTTDNKTCHRIKKFY